MGNIKVEVINSEYSKIELPALKITADKPVVCINFQGDEGNIYEVITKVNNALRNAGMDEERISLDKFINNAEKNPNYNETLKKMQEYVTLINISNMFN